MYKKQIDVIRTQIERSQFLEHSTPLYLTSSSIFEDAEDMRASFSEEKERNIYSRFKNPNTSEFVKKICKMEGAEDGFAFATGMAAVFSTFSALLSSADHIVSVQSNELLKAYVPVLHYYSMGKSDNIKAVFSALI